MTEDPGLPLSFAPVSNGEYEPVPISPLLRRVNAEAREVCDAHAKAAGLSRREFLFSSAALATVLYVLDRSVAAASIRPPGGHYPIPPEALVDPSAADAFFGEGDFVFDLQGHLLEYDLNPATKGRWFWGRQFPQADCGEDDPRACFTMEHFLEEIFLRSDTSMVALSGLPLLPAGSALPLEVMEETRRVVERLGGVERVIVNAQVLPTIAPFPAVAEEMERAVRESGVAGWKTFTHFPADSGWRLDDHDPVLPRVGDDLLAQIEKLNRPVLCVHKGLSGGSRLASPVDIGPAAATHPGVRLVVYHSGYEVDHVEGPFVDRPPYLGVNRLIASLRSAGIGPNQNVYAELGSTWWHLLRHPDQAAHVLGKLLLHVGENNVVWGTDSIFYGSPQPQIQALRAFQISDEFQQRFGYPALTGEIKRKILGLNAARVFGVEPVYEPFTFSRLEIKEARRTYPGSNRTYGPTTRAEVSSFRSHHQGWP